MFLVEIYLYLVNTYEVNVHTQVNILHYYIHMYTIKAKC